jgi:MFS transporter, Spinster family, sphingosine-1-phosphate transporter
MVGAVLSKSNAAAGHAGVIRRPMAILSLLTGLNLLNYIDRSVMSAVLPRVQDDLHLSNFMGGALATVFLIGYFATSPIFGSLADRAARGGRRRLLMLGVSVWSLATLASGLVHGAAALLGARAFVGVGEASYATIAPTLIDDLAPPSKKGRWMAIFSAALPLGFALGYVVGGAVEQLHGWRWAFFVAGGPGIVLALLCLLVAEPARHAAASLDVARAARSLLRLPLYRRTVLGYSAYTFAIGGFAFWAPKYVHERYGLESGRASVDFGLLTVAAGFVGTLTGGWLADLAVRRRSVGAKGVPRDAAGAEQDAARANLSVCALSAGLGAPLAAGAIAAASPTWFFVLTFLSETALFLSSGPVNVAILRSVPAELRASAMALAIFAIHLMGDLWSPLLIGMVADWGPATLGVTRMAPAMMLAPALFAVGALVWLRGSAVVSTRLT